MCLNISFKFWHRQSGGESRVHVNGEKARIAAIFPNPNKTAIHREKKPFRFEAFFSQSVYPRAWPLKRSDGCVSTLFGHFCCLQPHQLYQLLGQGWKYVIRLPKSTKFQLTKKATEKIHKVPCQKEHMHSNSRKERVINRNKRSAVP